MKNSQHFWRLEKKNIYILYKREIPPCDAGEREKGIQRGVCENICLLSQCEFSRFSAAQLCVCAMHTGRASAHITHTPRATRAINQNKMLNACSFSVENIKKDQKYQQQKREKRKKNTKNLPKILRRRRVHNK